MAEQTIPEAIRSSLQCRACHKFLRPPIWMCKNGHNVCDICKTATCPMCEDTIGDHNNAELEALIKHFKAPMSCKHNGAGCNETNDLAEILRHEEDCLFRSTKCLVVDCKAEITLNELENHVAEKHQDMKDVQWVIIPHFDKLDKGASVVRCNGNDSDPDGNPTGTGIITGPATITNCDFVVKWENGKTYSYRKQALKLAPSAEQPFAMRTWRHSDVRFFATLLLGKDDFWHIMVSAACGKNKAAKFRAEIRLASSSVPECSNVYHRPVEHLESEVDLSSMKKYMACLDVHKEDVAKQTTGEITNLEVAPEDIPFTCHVYEKVFVTFDKEDIEEKEN